MPSWERRFVPVDADTFLLYFFERRHSHLHFDGYYVIVRLLKRFLPTNEILVLILFFRDLILLKIFWDGLCTLGQGWRLTELALGLGLMGFNIRS